MGTCVLSSGAMAIYWATLNCDKVVVYGTEQDPCWTTGPVAEDSAYILTCSRDEMQLENAKILQELREGTITVEEVDPKCMEAYARPAGRVDDCDYEKELADMLWERGHMGGHNMTLEWEVQERWMREGKIEFAERRTEISQS